MAKEDRLVVSGAARPGSHRGPCDGLEKPDRNLLALKFLSHEKVKKNIYS
jgi:hypothetical protein